MDHEIVTLTEDGGTLLTFEDAVILTELLESYMNTEQGKQILADMGVRFGLVLKSEFNLTHGKITKNCPDCSGCHQGSCILGCTKTPGHDLCFWDEALEKIVGTGLVTHESAHIWFDQAFQHTLNEDSDEYFEMSEKFAQFVEDNFTESLVFCSECQEFVIDLRVLESNFPSIWENVLINSIVLGVGFGIGGFLATLALGWLTKDNPEINKFV